MQKCLSEKEETKSNKYENGENTKWNFPDKKN